MASSIASSSSSAMSAASPRSLYRSILRELGPKSTLKPSKTIASAAFTSQPIVVHVRDTFRASSGGKEEEALKEMRNLEVFLRSNRVHKELLVRYNPLHDQTEAERVRATARRVGLDVPKLYKAPPSAEEVDMQTKMSKAAEYGARKGKTGPLPPPELE